MIGMHEHDGYKPHSHEVRSDHLGVETVPGTTAHLALPAITKGDVIRIVPESGPERVMRVAHVEHHIITLADIPAGE